MAMHMINKEKYGEVFTPQLLIQEMYANLMKEPAFIDEFKKGKIKNIFEPGAGRGAFFNLFQNQHRAFPNSYYLMNEINPEHYVELKKVAHNYDPTEESVEVVIDDAHNLDFERSSYYQGFDLVLGNLPFNGNGKKMTPGNKHRNNVGNSLKATTIWTSITHLVFEKVLKYNGFYYCIIPSIWMKEDRAGIYDLFCKTYTICFMKNYDSYEAHKLFDYNCHSPVCYILVKKKLILYSNITSLELRDGRRLYDELYHNQLKPHKNEIPSILHTHKKKNKYDYYLGSKFADSAAYKAALSVHTSSSYHLQNIDYTKVHILKCYDRNAQKFIYFPHVNHTCLPTNHYCLFEKSILFFIAWKKKIEKELGSTSNITMYDEIKKVCFIRNTIVNNKVDGLIYTGTLQDALCGKEQYKLISGATILKNDTPSACGSSNSIGLNGFICTLPGIYQGQKKVIMPHKRFLHVLRDYTGLYGLYGRDMYAYLCNTDEEVDVLANFLELGFVKSMVEEGFSVRMNFIEKHVFQYLPNIFHPHFDSELYLKMMSI